MTTDTSLYRLREHFLSPAEQTFYLALSDILRDQLVREILSICPKVAVADLITVSRPNENIHQLSKLHRKTIDFLLIQRQSLKPMLAIELDYPKQAHHSSDKFLEEVFISAELPFIRITVKEQYDKTVLAYQIRDALGRGQPGESQRKHEDFSPICPNCGITMVLRFHKSGKEVGKKYYGCLNYPECQQTIPVE